MRDIYRLAQETSTPMAATVELFTRLGRAAGEIGATRPQILQFTETVQKLAVVSGATSSESANALLQLSQALASGVLRGDELRSIMENMPALAKAIADGLKVSVGQLREMGAEGKLLATDVFAAILKATDQARQQFENMPLTVERASTRMANAWQAFLARLDESVGASEKLVALYQFVTKQLDNSAGGSAQTRETAIRTEIAQIDKQLAGRGHETLVKEPLRSRKSALQDQLAPIDMAADFDFYAKKEIEARDRKQAEEQKTKRENEQRIKREYEQQKLLQPFNDEMQAGADKAADEYYRKLADKAANENIGERMQGIAENWGQATEAERGQYLRYLDDNIAAYEKNLTEQASQTESHTAKLSRINKDYRDAEAKAEEMFQKDLQEAQEATNRYYLKEQERKELEDVWTGGKKAAEDYFTALDQNGRRAGNFVGGVFRTMEDSLTKFYATGKGKISDFFDGIKMGLARLAAQDTISAIGKVLGLGNGSTVGTIGSFVGSLFGFAGGGRPQVGQAVLVGEHGPEVAVFDRPATVYSNAQSRSMAAANDNGWALADRVASMGAPGDTELIHVMPREMPAIRSVLGQGRLNPRTGLWGFADSPDGGFGGSTDTGQPGQSGSNAGPESGGQTDPADASIGISVKDMVEHPGGGMTSQEEHDFLTDYIASLTKDPTTGLATRGFRDRDDKVVNAVKDWGVNVGSAISRGQSPSIGDYVRDFFGIDNPGGFLGSSALGWGLSLIGTLLGVPAFGFIAGLSRAALSGGTARGTGVAGDMYGLLSGSRQMSTPVGRIADALFNGVPSLGANDTGPLSNMADIGGVDTPQSVASLMSLDAAGRASMALSGVSDSLGGLRGGLASDFSGVVSTGRAQVAMAGLPGFRNGGEFEVGGAGGEDSQLVAFRASPGEKVRVTPPSQDDGATLREVVRLLHALVMMSADGDEKKIALLAEVSAMLKKLESRGQLANAA